MFSSRRGPGPGSPDDPPGGDSPVDSTGGWLSPAHGSAGWPRPRSTGGTHGELSLLSLLELSNELNVRMDLYEIADVALFNFMGHFGCSRGAFWVLSDDASQDAVLVRGQGIADPVAKAVGAVWTRWLMNRPGGMLEPVLISELKDLVNAPGLELAEHNGIALFAPVSARKSLLGLVALGHRVAGGTFGPFDREVLLASLNLLGVAVENTNLYNRAVENNRRLRRANEQLQELDRLKSEFFRNVNHELRTPLTIMIAYLDSVLSSEPEGSRREHLDVVREQTTKLHGMLLNLLDFGRLLEDRLEMQIARGDVRESLSHYYEDRRPGITADVRELIFSAGSDVPQALFDRDRLLQIVDCLVDNAVKFTPPGSHIHLRVDAETVDGMEWVRIDVQDDGPGIPADRLTIIFDSFRQGDGSDTREHGGMGIGLAFARRLAEKMNGRLDVESGIGKGTVFSLWLPAA